MAFNEALRIYRAGGQPCSLRHRNKPIDCIPAPSPDATTLIAGGFYDDYESSLMARRDDFIAAPRSGEAIVLAGRESKILKVESSPIHPLIVLHYGTMNR